MNQTIKSTYFARKLRSNFTNAERILWSTIKNRKLDGIKFRRQFPIENYIADFVSVEKKIIIKVDGEQHNEEENIFGDNIRTKYLEQQGYSVIRFWNNDVLTNLDWVISKIQSVNCPHPTPLPKGEGKKGENGQALITLLFFIVIAVTVTSAGIIVLATSSLASSKFEEGNTAYYAAESGMENALLELARNPSYTGETVSLGTASVTISVTAGSPITILSTATEGRFIRKIQVQATNTNNILTISSWKEVY